MSPATIESDVNPHPWSVVQRTNLWILRFHRVAPMLFWAYIIVLLLPLLSPFRPVTLDELILADSAYAITNGESLVPAAKIWSHVFPAFGVMNHYYPPLQLYALAAAYYLFGLSVIPTGVLHLLLRASTIWVIFLTARARRLSATASTFLAAVWATLAHGEVGRPEDLAILLIVCSVWMVVRSNRSHRLLTTSGVCLGLAFLCHPASIATSSLAFTALALAAPRGMFLRRSLVLTVSMVAVVLLWLPWILTYWATLRGLFLDFPLPDARSHSAINSLHDLGIMAIKGVNEYSSLVPLQSSSLPIITLIFTFAAIVYRRQAASRGDLVAMMLPLAAVLVLVSRVRVHPTYLVWLNVCVIALIILASGRFEVVKSQLSRGERATLFVLLMTISAQLVAAFGRYSLYIVGDAAALSAVGPHPHGTQLAMLPRGENIITNAGYVFYHIRARNPVRWPAGLEGLTPGGVPFKASYDIANSWLVLPYKVEQHPNPGHKCHWNSPTREWFLHHYQLETASMLEGSHINRGLARFSMLPRELYFYRGQERLPSASSFSSALAEARYWLWQQDTTVNATREEARRHPQGFDMVDTETWRLSETRNDRQGYLRRSIAAAQKASSLARDTNEKVRAGCLLARLYCDLGDHSSELRVAASVTRLDRARTEGFLRLRHAARCTQKWRLLQSAESELRHLAGKQERVALRRPS
jgi:4-amino-4-deoxy-L-arabinose transferase-like glycosyltransferase